MSRGDKQIGGLETMAILLLLQTYGSLLANNMMTSYIDSNGSMSAWIKGGSTSPEQNIFVGMGWLMMAELNVSSHFLRVASFSNLADGPSRGHVEELLAM